MKKRTCVQSILQLQNPDEFNEGVHIEMFPEFIYLHYFGPKPQGGSTLLAANLGQIDGVMDGQDGLVIGPELGRPIVFH